MKGEEWDEMRGEEWGGGEEGRMGVRRGRGGRVGRRTESSSDTERAM